MKNKRKHVRVDSETYCEVVVQIQDGLLFHRIVPLQVDCSEGGAQFLIESDDIIQVGRTALIYTHTGTPPEKDVIEAKISWISNQGGRMWFGCEFLQTRPGEPGKTG